MARYKAGRRWTEDSGASSRPHHAQTASCFANATRTDPLNAPSPLRRRPAQLPELPPDTDLQALIAADVVTCPWSSYAGGARFVRDGSSISSSPAPCPRSCTRCGIHPDCVAGHVQRIVCYPIASHGQHQGCGARVRPPGCSQARLGKSTTGAAGDRGAQKRLTASRRIPHCD